VLDGAVDGYGFTGEMTDDNGLVYLRARHYAPSIGSFVSLDPFEGMICSPMSFNGYSWVEGNVANWSDPSGLTHSLSVALNGGQCNKNDVLVDRDCSCCETPTEAYMCQELIRTGFNICPCNTTPPIIHTFADSEYPLSCDGFSDTETCMLYHMIFLSGTDTITGLRSRNGYLRPDDYAKFASFVAPDSLWSSLHPLGTPADIKDHYTIYENSTNQGTCISMYGMLYGRDVPGNIIYGYIGRLAGIPSWILITGAGGAQASHDFLEGNPLSSVDLLNDFGDSPEDTEAVLTGIALYEKFGDFITMSNIRFALESLRPDYVSASQISNRAQCRPTS